MDWHRDPVHGKGAPRVPWFAIDTLDFARTGDNKITWELNRHQHFVTLAKAYRLTGKQTFLAELLRQWQDWEHENPYPIGVNWASSLEVAFRSLSWIWAYFLIDGSPALPAGFRTRWLRGLGLGAAHIERYLSTYSSPNTHLLGEGVALFFIGVLCPELRRAEKWKRRGWAIVRQEAQRQVRADGLHFEQSTHYHVYALDFFLHAAVLAKANDVPTPSELEETLQRMLDVLRVLGRVGPPQLGDDDGGRLFDPRRNRPEHLLDPLATGAALFARPDFKAVSGGLREETVWLLGEKGVADFDRLASEPLPVRSVALAAGGLYVMASPASQLVVDAGPQGAFAAGHGHADALGLTLAVAGGAALVDSGTFAYAGESGERDRFRGTSAHNTLTVDGRDQAEPAGPFAWTALPRVTAETWISGRAFDLFAGRHDGYSRLTPPVVHRRWVFGLRSRFWLVRDRAEGTGEHRLDLFWHLHPRLAARGGDFLDARGHDGLRIVGVEDERWSRDLREGWWSPAYAAREPAPVLHFGTVATLPVEFATLLAPLTGGGGPAGRLSRIAPATEGAPRSAYRYETAEDVHTIVFGEGEAWTLGGWRSDAVFFYWGQSRDGQRRTLLCGQATTVEGPGGRILSSARPAERCEIVATSGRVEVWPVEIEASVSRDAVLAAGM
jgi:hypothetical protein